MTTPRPRTAAERDLGATYRTALAQVTAEFRAALGSGQSTAELEANTIIELIEFLLGPNNGAITATGIERAFKLKLVSELVESRAKREAIEALARTLAKARR